MTRTALIQICTAAVLASAVGSSGCTRSAEGINNGVASARPDAGGGFGVDPDSDAGAGGAPGSGGSVGVAPDAPGTSAEDANCPAGTHVCGGICVSSQDPQHCGNACQPCPGLGGGSSTCDGFKCGVMCPAGQQPCVDRCVDRNAACENKCPPGKNPCGGICVDPTTSRPAAPPARPAPTMAVAPHVSMASATSSARVGRSARAGASAPTNLVAMSAPGTCASAASSA